MSSEPLTSTALPRFFRVQPGAHAASQSASMDWLWQGYLAAGQITLLTSLWKSGKTTLVSVLLSRLSEGGQLLGLKIAPARALILSEESPDLWGMRHRRHAFGAGIEMICRPYTAKPDGADWQALLDDSLSILGATGQRLLVIDTVATLMPSGVETNSDCMSRALAPFAAWQSRGSPSGSCTTRTRASPASASGRAAQVPCPPA